ncbi:MAG: zf-TFIIB domain-containing protein [Deltaproteobacteria bacterium]|nr:zf-TFIIB domain-containing protein [Deltaproteobacteria bacterium]
MLNCPKCTTVMDAVLTRAGVIIDVCKGCKGVWLDQGELNFFVKNKKLLDNFNIHGLHGSEEQLFRCPKCNINMKAGQIPGFKHEIEECPSCKGLFFDEHEFKKIGSSNYFSKCEPDSQISLNNPKLLPSKIVPIIKVPSLAMTSGVVLITMYAVLFGFVVFLIEAGFVPYIPGLLIVVGFILLQFLLGPILMDISLSLFGSLEWINMNELPLSFRDSLTRLCNENKLSPPTIGIIHDGAPQAYTYGRTPWSARVVLSKGIFDLLDENEVEAILAHELGHIKHWDFVIMTLAQLVPVLFYHIYRLCMALGNSKSNNKNSKNSAGQYLVAMQQKNQMLC